MAILKLKKRSLETGTIPGFMGILNVTPDSFSDGGSEIPLKKRIELLLEAGTDILDIGGESTRPGSETVSIREELSRVIPALELTREISKEVIISIDTRKSEVARECLKRDADIINDVSGFRFDPAMLQTALDFESGVVAMHSRSTPDQMQSAENLEYPHGVETVLDELKMLVGRLVLAGIPRERIIADAGIGFAKSAELCAEITRSGSLFRPLGCMTLSAPSRKAYIGRYSGEKEASLRDPGTCGAAISSALHGYDLLRVHNVKAVREALAVFFACEKEIAGKSSLRGGE